MEGIKVKNTVTKHIYRKGFLVVVLTVLIHKVHPKPGILKYKRREIIWKLLAFVLANQKPMTDIQDAATMVKII